MENNEEEEFPELPKGVLTLADSVKMRLAAGEGIELAAGRCWMDGWRAHELMIADSKQA